MDWRLARSLIQLRSELDTLYPKRDRTSDGSIGDAAHASRTSDHNPWVKDHNGQPIVTAVDIDRDIAPDFRSRDLAEWLRQRKDSRIKYVISNAKMYSSYSNNVRKAWEWGKYTGSNAHKEHMHISVMDVESLYDAQRPWGLGTIRPGAGPKPAPPHTPEPQVQITQGRPTLRLGSAGSDVKYLQRMLGNLEVDGDFGPATKARVIAFQKRAGLDQTGVVDHPTWVSLEE